MNIVEVELSPGFLNGNALDVLWQARIDLMELYKSKGKLPQWPLDLTVEEGQNFLRDLMGYLEEEMVEAFSLMETTELKARKGELEYKDKADYLTDFNEEVADTLHFWFEVFVYCGIGPDDLDSYYRQLCKEKLILPEKEIDEVEDVITLMIAYGSALVYLNEGIKRDTFRLGAWDMWDEAKGGSISPYVNKLPIELTVGGRFLSKKVVNSSEHYIFQSMKHLKVARNTLKLKYWRTQDNKPNMEVLHLNLMEAWLFYLCFLCRNNFLTSTQIEHLYLRKHIINIERQNTGW